MNILVTGVSGFIGSRIAEHLLDRGNNVIGVCREKSAYKVRHLETRDGFTVKGVHELHSNVTIDVVIHAAAQCPHGDVSLSSYIESNIYFSQEIAEYAQLQKVQKVIYLSAVSVYGDVDVSCVDETTDIKNPGPYGLTKYVAEEIFREKRDFFSTVCLRLPGIVGRGAVGPWLTQVLSQAHAHQPIKIHNPEASFNNVLAVDDLVAFIGFLCTFSFDRFNVVTLAAHGTTTIREAVDCVLRETNSRSELIVSKEGKKSFTISKENAVRSFGYTARDVIETIERYVSSERKERQELCADGGLNA